MRYPYIDPKVVLKGDPAKCNNSMHLNGGGVVVQEILKKRLKEMKLTRQAFAEQAGVSVNTINRLVLGKHPGVRVSHLDKVVKAFGGDTKKVIRAIAAKNKRRPKKTGGKPAKQKRGKKELGQILSALGIQQSELSCSFTIGDERITVERMPGQADQPVVVEHGGHRLTVAKV